MGNFNVKNFFGSMFTPVQDEEIEGGQGRAAETGICAAGLLLR